MTGQITEKNPRSPQRFVIFLTALALAFTQASHLAEAEDQTALFGSREIKSTNMQAFSKWTSVWRRYALARREAGLEFGASENAASIRDYEACKGPDRARCVRQNWETFIAGLKGQPPQQQLKAVNAYMNKHPYIVDPVNWGLPDYWATPDEFMMRDGDCEDFAISKYVTLKRLGMDPAQMRLVVVQDENLRTPHAVLAVMHDGETLILDNQVDQVISHKAVHHYRPVYSINEEAWWLHQRR